MENLFHKLEKRKKIKIRQVHILNVQRQLVYDVIYDLVPEGLENRTPYLQEKKRNRNKMSRILFKNHGKKPPGFLKEAETNSCKITRK